jgi:hypothetical protein
MMGGMSRFWIAVGIVICAAIFASFAINSAYPYRLRGDPLPPAWTQLTVFGGLFGFIGFACWSFCFQTQLRRGQLSLKALLALPLALAVAVKSGLWLLFFLNQ